MYILRKTENGTTADIGMYDTLERLVNAAAGHAKNRQEHGRLIPLYGVEETGDLDDVCARAVQTFDDTENNTVCIEELSELQKEVCKRMRGAENDDHMAEEIADAEICIEKLKIRYGLRERAMDCLMLNPAQAASLIGCDPQGLRMTAREDPQSLGFPVVVIGSRVKIPRVPLIRFLGG